MKKVLSFVLGIKEDDILTWGISTIHDLTIGTESDYGKSYSIVEGSVYEPRYEIKLIGGETKWVDMSEVFEFLFSKISNQ